MGERMEMTRDDQLRFVVLNWHKIGLRAQLWVVYHIWRASLHCRRTA